MLKSTAKGIVDFWSVPNESYQTNGGAIQYFKHKDKRQIELIEKI